MYAFKFENWGNFNIFNTNLTRVTNMMHINNLITANKLRATT